MRAGNCAPDSPRRRRGERAEQALIALRGKNPIALPPRLATVHTFPIVKLTASFRLPTILAILSLIPALAHAHPGHGGGEGIGHHMSHAGLGLIALLFACALGVAAKKLQALNRSRRAAKHARAEELAAAAQRLASERGE